MMHRSSLLFASSFLLGCAGAPSASAVQQAIVGGTTDTSDPAIVMFVANVKGQMQSSLCTAEVLSPHVVLTAAHCVDPTLVGTGADYYIYLGNSIDTIDHTLLIKLFTVHEDPKFSPNLDNITTNGHDIAVGILPQPVTMQPISFNHVALPKDYVNKSARIVGYGLSNVNDANTAGTKRQGDTTITDINELFVGLGGGSNQSITCEGDSGGPALIKVAGREQIVGITSFGDNSCTPSRGGEDTRVDLYADFVDGYIQQLDPPTRQGAVGDACTLNTDCQSQICGADGDKTFCTVTCDPSGANICPMGYTCSDIDDVKFCAPKHSGCSMAGAAAPGATPLGLLVGALLATRLGRRRRLTR